MLYLSIGGEGSSGYIPTLESKIKNSNSNKKQIFTIERRNKLSEKAKRKRKPLSENHKDKLRDAVTGNKNGFYGKHHSKKNKTSY